MQEARKARITAQGFKEGVPSDVRQQAATSLQILFQPGEGLIVISESCVNHGQIESDYVMPRVTLFKFFEDCERLGALAADRIQVCEIAALGSGIGKQQAELCFRICAAITLQHSFSYVDESG